MAKRCSIIGAGIAGCVVARMLADHGMSVYLYEQSGSIGGILRMLPGASIAPIDRQVGEWLCARTPLYPQEDGSMCPRRGYTWLCEQLIAHKGISLMKHCCVRDIVNAQAGVEVTVSTVPPDRVTHARFGELPWVGGFPVHNETTWQQWQAYQLLFGQAGIFSCGSLASYQVLSIPHIIRQAMTITEAIARPSSSVSSSLRVPYADGMFGTTTPVPPPQKRPTHKALF